MSKCSKSEIERDGYSFVKKTGTTVSVKLKCITDKGKPGKGPKLIIMPKEDRGILSEYGYSLKNSYEDRIKSIKKATKDHSKLKILRHINALRTLQKSNERNYNKLDKDLKWIQGHLHENA